MRETKHNEERTVCVGAGPVTLEGNLAAFEGARGVGGDDEPVIELNELAMSRMRGQVKLEVIPGATHLFEEPGMLEEVARLARGWFVRHLATAGEWSASMSDERTTDLPI